MQVEKVITILSDEFQEKAIIQHIKVQKSKEAKEKLKLKSEVASKRRQDIDIKSNNSGAKSMATSGINPIAQQSEYLKTLMSSSSTRYLKSNTSSTSLTKQPTAKKHNFLQSKTSNVSQASSPNLKGSSQVKRTEINISPQTNSSGLRFVRGG